MLWKSYGENVKVVHWQSHAEPVSLGHGRRGDLVFRNCPTRCAERHTCESTGRNESEPMCNAVIRATAPDSGNGKVEPVRAWRRPLDKVRNSMSERLGAGEARLPGRAEFSLDPICLPTPVLPRRIKDGMCGTSYEVTQETCTEDGLAFHLTADISVSEVRRVVRAGGGAGSSSDDMGDSITPVERRTRALEMLGLTGIVPGSVLHSGGIR